MKTVREHEAEVFTGKSPAPVIAGARDRARLMEAGAPASRKNFRGVSHLPSGKYAAGIKVLGSKKRQWLGTYDEEEVAACAYDLAAKSLRGSKARTNFDYPPPYKLIDKVTKAPGRRGPVYPVPAPPPPAPAPDATPPAAPTLATFDHFSFMTPPSEPAPFAVCPWLLDPGFRQSRLTITDPSRLVRRAATLASEPGAKITFVRSIPPKPFSIKDAVTASHRVSHPVDISAAPIHIVAPVPASSARTCASSTTDPQPRASDSSSWRMVSSSTHLKLKTPKIFAIPDEGFSGDNFSTNVNVPCKFTIRGFCGL